MMNEAMMNSRTRSSSNLLSGIAGIILFCLATESIRYLNFKASCIHVKISQLPARWHTINRTTNTRTYRIPSNAKASNITTMLLRRGSILIEFLPSRNFRNEPIIILATGNKFQKPNEIGERICEWD